ncbi:ABC transporter ATP-binding protein [Tropicimonas sp. IMCC34011]|uniref:ABC transporter ATP-binding protein n=1 Tax=Tropicimonas sp. IMCC34011 TaxID=2248759 RepID=UPI0018E556D4|nr:ABC transporter ATP-binding protein [Tropicimonas sp. IMCC34011]
MIDFGTWKKAWALLDSRERRNAWIVLGIVIVGAMSSALMVGSVLPFLSVLADPELIKTVPALAWAYDTFGFESDYGFLTGLGLAALAVIVLTSAMQVFKTWAVARFATMRMHSISHRLMRAYMRQPYEFFLNRHTGEMGTRILAETQQLVMQFLRPAAEAVAALLTIVAIVSLLLWMEPVVAMIAFALLGGSYGGIYALSRRILKKLGEVRVETNTARFRIATEALGGIKDIKLLGRESSYSARYGRPSHRMARTMATTQVISQVPKFMLDAVAFGGIILLCLFLMNAEGLASGTTLGGILPTLGLFAVAGQRLMPELSKLYQSLAHIQASSAAVDIIYDDLIVHAGSGKLPDTMPPALGLTEQLVLEDVTYHYPNAAHAGVKEVSLTINAGEKIGIVGSTGAGKTTLADIILGLLAPSTGRLFADGVEITVANLRAWQQSVGYVPQDIFLTAASVTENIALGIPLHEIDQQAIERAAQIAQIDGFIRNELPKGYATQIGERGVRLSGGQRQRIGVARALYHDADLIVFDEATSALDNLTEREVMAAIEALPDEKTVLMIAHRLSTVERCDRIVMLEAGCLIAYDTWDVLLRDNSHFRRLAQGEQCT